MSEICQLQYKVVTTRVTARLCIAMLCVTACLRIELDGKSWAVLASAAEAELRDWELDKTGD